MAANFNKFNSFVQAIGTGLHDLSSDQITVALCAAAHAPVATNTVLANLTEVAYDYCSTRDVTTTSFTNTSGTSKLILADLTLTASGGAIGPFRYVVLYNNTATNDELVGYYDYGSDVTVNDGETFLIDFDGSAGVLTLA